jgi:hypothetical protein
MRKFILVILCCFLFIITLLGCNAGQSDNIEDVNSKIDKESLGEEISITIKESGTTSAYAEKNPAVMVIKNENGFDAFSKNYLTYIMSDDKKTSFIEVLQKNYIIATFMGEKTSGGYNLILSDKANLDEGKLYLSAEFKTPTGSNTTTQMTSPYALVVVNQSRMNDEVSAIILYDNNTSIVKAVNDFSGNVFE